MDKKESFLQYLRTEKRYSRNTVSSYKNDLDQFFKWLEVNAPDLTAEDVTSGEVRAWIVSIIENGCATGTVHTRKIRQFAQLIRGKRADEALEALRFFPNRGRGCSSKW